jgi:hypothetical protein
MNNIESVIKSFGYQIIETVNKRYYIEMKQANYKTYQGCRDLVLYLRATGNDVIVEPICFAKYKLTIN